MATVTTLIVDSLNVRIDWTKPYDNSETIDQYKILILQSNGIYSEIIDYCNGYDEVIKTQEYCDIPMRVLRASPFNLA
jgi:hypothetical protein